MLVQERRVGEADCSLVADVTATLADMELGYSPTALEEAQRILGRFNRAVIDHPEEFADGRWKDAVRCLKKAIARHGVTLDQLETTPRKLFRYIRFVITT